MPTRSSKAKEGGNETSAGCSLRGGCRRAPLRDVPDPGADSLRVLVVGMELGMITSLDPAKGFEVYGSGVMAHVYDRLLDFATRKV